MGKFVCKCGHVISDVEYPSSSNGTLFTEQSFDQYLSKVGSLLDELNKADSEGKRVEWIKLLLGESYPIDASDSELHEDLLSKGYEDYSVSTVKCTSCGRLHVQKASGVNEYVSFLRED